MFESEISPTILLSRPITVMAITRKSEENGADRYLGKAAVGCTGPAGYPVVFPGYQQDDGGQS